MEIRPRPLAVTSGIATKDARADATRL
jgi:hypothetical protein